MLEIKPNQVDPQKLDVDNFHSSLEFLSPTNPKALMPSYLRGAGLRVKSVGF